jgi:hypothetical protein
MDERKFADMFEGSESDLLGDLEVSERQADTVIGGAEPVNGGPKDADAVNTLTKKK